MFIWSNLTMEIMGYYWVAVVPYDNNYSDTYGNIYISPGYCYWKIKTVRGDNDKHLYYMEVPCWRGKSGATYVDLTNFPNIWAYKYPAPFYSYEKDNLPDYITRVKRIFEDCYFTEKPMCQTCLIGDKLER